MADPQEQASLWQKMVNQSFLSLYHLPENKITDPEYFQGYDFVFEFSNAIIYLLVTDVVMPVSRHDIDAAKVREWRKDIVNELIRRHNQLYLKNNKSLVGGSIPSYTPNYALLNNAPLADKATYFIGLTSLSIKHLDEQPEVHPHTVEYEYGSQFFAEDCVLDLDDEQSVLQVFSYQGFTKILKQLVTTSDIAAFLQFHRSQLADFQSFQDETTLLKRFFESPDFYQRAIKVQQQLVDAGLMDKIEPRLLTATAPKQSAFAKELTIKIHKNTQTWYELFNSLIKRHYQACVPLPKEQVKILVDESMYTYSCLMEKILAYRNIDKESCWNGYVCHQHSYSVFGRHYMIVFYAQNESSPLSAINVRANHQELLSELNAELQQPVMEDLFLIGVNFKPCKASSVREVTDINESNNSTEIYLDAFHQSGSVLNASMQHLYEQLAKLKSQV